MLLMTKPMQKYVCGVLAALFMAQGLVFALPTGQSASASGPLAAFTAGCAEPVFLAIGSQPQRPALTLLPQLAPSFVKAVLSDTCRMDGLRVNGHSSPASATSAPTLFALGCMLTV